MSGTAVFRVDASREIGGGHLARSLTLADGLHEAGWRTVIAARAGSREMLPGFSRKAHDWLVLPDGDEKPVLREYCFQGAELLVVDHYGLDAEFGTALRPWAKWVLVIDDLADRPYDANILLDPTFGRDVAVYRDLVPEHCQMLLGPQFALLRPAFAKEREGAINRRKGGKRPLCLLISLGAGNSGDLAARIASHVVEHDHDVIVNIVYGAEQTRALATRHDRITEHGMVRDMAGLMAAADLSVGAAGGTSWERCCLGLPGVVVVLADNQREIATALNAAGAIDYVEAKGQPEVAVAVAEAVAALLRDDGRRAAMGNGAAAICDGAGVDRVISTIKELQKN